MIESFLRSYLNHNLVSSVKPWQMVLLLPLALLAATLFAGGIILEAASSPPMDRYKGD
jgi:hypothetical protein